MLFNYGMQVIPQPDMIDDAIHETFIDIWKYKGTLHVQAPKSYLIRCLRNKLLKSKKEEERKDKVIRSYAEDEFQLEYDAFHIQELIEHNSELETYLQEALKQLSPQQREIIFLVFYQNMSYQEVAVVLDIKIKTVYNQIYRALQNLRNILPVSIFTLFFPFFT